MLVEVTDRQHAEESLQVRGLHGEQVDLLLADAVMPGRSGRDLCERPGPRNRVLKALYASGYTVNAAVDHGDRVP